MPKNNSLVLSVKSIFNTLLILTAMLVAASVAGQVMKYIFGHPKVYGLEIGRASCRERVLASV